MRARVKRYGAAFAAAGTLVLAGCGGERTFTAEEFVGEIGDEGVTLHLGKELFTNEGGKELYALELEPAADLPGEAHTHSGGSISVYEDGDGAEEEFQSCEDSADLLCYRASNIVVVLEGGGGVETQQLSVAIQRLSD
jgi:hypothetical protein